MYTPKPVGWTLLYCLCRFPFLILVLPVLLGVMLFWPGSNVPEECLPSAAITFSFDDGYKSVVDNALPILEKYGFKGTAFVITGSIGQVGYMSWKDLQLLQQKGWEIGSHTVTHPDLTELTDAQLHYELATSKAQLQAQGLLVETFASPYGRYDERVLEAISRYYVAHRTGWPAELNEIPLRDPKDRYELKAVDVKAETSVEEVKEWILRAKNEGKWLILIFHRIDYSAGEYSWPPEKLEAVVRFAFEQGFRGISMNSLR